MFALDPHDALFAALFVVFFGLFAIWVRRSLEKEADWNTVLARLKAQPLEITELHLIDNDPILLEVCGANGKWLKPDGPHGVAAVRLYDELRQLAPHALAYVTRNGRRVAHQGDVPDLSVRLS